MDEVIEAMADGIRDRLGIADMRRHVRIPKYTPAQNFSVWLAAFEQRCVADDIPQENWKQELLANLDVQTAYASVIRLNLPEYLPYQEFKERLEERFCSIGTASEFRERFRNCLQGKNEDVDEFADKLLELAAQAFPNLAQEHRNEEILDQFIKGVRAVPSIKEALMIGQIGSLQEAKRMLRRLITAKELTHRHQDSVRTAEDQELREQLNKQADMLEQQRKEIEQLKRLARPVHPVQQHMHTVQPPVQPPAHPVQRQQYLQQQQQQQAPRCFNCGQPGHLQMHCQQPRLPRGSQRNVALQSLLAGRGPNPVPHPKNGEVGGAIGGAAPRR